MRGQGRVFRPVVRGGHTNVWWLDYSVHGERHRESSGFTSKRDAQRMLRQRIGDREAGKLIGRPDRVVLAEYITTREGKQQLTGGLRWLHETQYDLDGLRSKVRVVQLWAHLEKFFGASARVATITPTRIDEYATARLAEGAARQTVKNELSALRRGFSLAVEKGLLAVAPGIKLAKGSGNARSGFFEDGNFAAVLLELPLWLQPAIRFLRFTGWRIEEALHLTWDMIDWEGAVIRLAAADTKGKKARLFPFGLAPDLKALLDAQWKGRSGEYVFHQHGQHITYDGAWYWWKAARKRAGLPKALIHDLRRSAARDFRRLGVSEGEIMQLCGWKTRSMFDRYNIIDEADLAAAVAKRFAPPNGKQKANTEGTAAPAGPLS